MAHTDRPTHHSRMSATQGTERQILRSVLDQWRSAVDAHHPDRAASYFTDDVIFQGLHPYSVGPKGVAEYYASQPIGMTAAYTIQETRRLADDLVLAISALISPSPIGRFSPCASA